MVKAKKCRQCKAEFSPVRALQSVCSVACALAVAAARREKAARASALQERKETHQALIRLKPRSVWMREAQAAFNRFIRMRDVGNPCICCNKPLPLDAVGGAYDCGHYRSVGSAPHLRFDERNAHGQLKQCNRWGSGRAVDYRLGLIRKIGLAEVEALEADQSVKKWTIDDLKAIKSIYTEKYKEIQRGRWTGSQFRGDDGQAGKSAQKSGPFRLKTRPTSVD